jgi:hypothetical protein
MDDDKQQEQPKPQPKTEAKKSKPVEGPKQAGPKLEEKAEGPPKPEPVIYNLLVEARIICSLRDPHKLPNDIRITIFNEPSPSSYFAGASGKAYLRPLTEVRYRSLEEEGKASTVLRYDLPSNSDLIGEPISSLSRYVKFRINLWAIHYEDFQECGFLEVTVRVNGRDIFRRSFTQRLVLDVPDKTKWVEIPLNEMKLPQ